METTDLSKKPNAKEQRELAEINARISKIDMERAELLKQIRNNVVYAVQHIKDNITKIIGKYYKTPNDDVVYNVLSGDVVLNSTMPGVVKNKYAVTLNVTKFNRLGTSYDTTYNITTPELPKDVHNWLCMGNVEMTPAEAKQYITASLIAEKKALQEKLAEINEKLK